MSNKTILALCAICALVGFGSAYYFLPTKIVEKTKIVTQTKVKTNVVTVVTEKPDGSKTTVITDHTTTDSGSTTDHLKISEYSKPNWILSASYLASANNINARAYGFGLSRRIFGNIYIGATGNTTGNFGLGVSLVF